MGYTSFSVHVLEKLINEFKPKSVLDYGAQNMYNQPVLPAPYAKEWYEGMGIMYTAIDISGENGALPINLSEPITENLGQFDLVVDCGTSEHCGIDGKHSPLAFYNAVKNKHDLLKGGGVMFNENPKTGNWIGHGFNYYSQEFYRKLATLVGYEILELGEVAAMGNVTDGWNVYCVLRKIHDQPFISFEQFQLCEQLTK
jgi:hypothetical protein